MVALVIAFPITVTGLLDKPLNVDLNTIKIDVPQMEFPPLDFGPPAKPIANFFCIREICCHGKTPERQLRGFQQAPHADSVRQSLTSSRR